MKEMLLVGRGGEGVVLASQILADAFARAGFWVQSFPEFTAERRGAPIAAYLRWDEAAPIHRRYKVRECDVLVVVSPSPPPVQALRRVKPGGLVILNRETRIPSTGQFGIARVPASRIAQENGILSSEGRPMGNVAVLGACVRQLMPQKLECLEQSVAARTGSLADANVAAARAGYERCTRQHALAGDAPGRAGARARLGRAAREASGLPAEHDGLPREPHRNVVARPAAAHRRVHRLRRVRALLPRGGDHARQRVRRDRLPLLQGLRHL